MKSINQKMILERNGNGIGPLPRAMTTLYGFSIWVMATSTAATSIRVISTATLEPSEQ